MQSMYGEVIKLKLERTDMVLIGAYILILTEIHVPSLFFVESESGSPLDEPFSLRRMKGLLAFFRLWL